MKKLLFDILKKQHNPNIEILEDGMILIDDILKNINPHEFGLDKDSLENYNNYKIVAIMETSPLLKDKFFETDIVYLYFIMNNKETDIYIGLDYLHPFLWLHLSQDYTTLETEIKKLIGIYCSDTFYDIQDSDTIFVANECGFIGTDVMLEMTIDDFESYIVSNNFCEYFMWGSAWSDFPYRDKLLNKTFSKCQLERMTTHSLKQSNTNKLSLSVRTKASKSIVSFEYIDGAFIVRLHYNPMHNKSIEFYNSITENNLPLDIPLDVFGAICQFSYHSYKQILDMTPLTTYNISLAILLSNSEKKLLDTIHILDNYNFIDDEIKHYASSLMKILKVNIKLSKIDSDDINRKIIELGDHSIESNILTELVEYLCDIIHVDKSDTDIKNHLIILANGYINKLNSIQN